MEKYGQKLDVKLNSELIRANAGSQRPRCSPKRPFRRKERSIRRVKEITSELIRFIKTCAKPTCRRLKDNNANEFSWTNNACLRAIVCQRAPGFMRTVPYVCQNVRNART